MANNAYLTYYQKNKELVLNKANAGLSEEEKDKKREYRRNKYHTMSDKEKNKRNEYERNRYHSMTEEQKAKKREYAKNRYNTMIKAC